MEKKVKQLLSLWLTLPENAFKQTGPYWEALIRILEKYAPMEYSKYESFAGPFEHENRDVLLTYDLGSDEKNFDAALEYMSARQNSITPPDDVHIIEIDGDDYAYVPNMRIDQDEYFGRE